MTGGRRSQNLIPSLALGNLPTVTCQKQLWGGQEPVPLCTGVNGIHTCWKRKRSVPLSRVDIPLRLLSSNSRFNERVRLSRNGDRLEDSCEEGGWLSVILRLIIPRLARWGLIPSEAKPASLGLGELTEPSTSSSITADGPTNGTAKLRLQYPSCVCRFARCRPFPLVCSVAASRLPSAPVTGSWREPDANPPAQSSSASSRSVRGGHLGLRSRMPSQRARRYASDKNSGSRGNDELPLPETATAME